MNWKTSPRRKITQLTLTFVLCGVVMAGLTGCAAVFFAGAGAGAYSYIAGNLSRVYETDYRRAVRVSAGVIDQLKFTLNRQTGDALKTVLEGKRADDTPVTITVEWVGDGLTRIGVRTGVVGLTSMEISEQIHNKIAKNLKGKKRDKKPAKATVIKSSPKKVKPGEQSESGDRTASGDETENQTDNMGKMQSSDKSDGSEKNSVTLPRNSLFIYYQKSEINVPAHSFETLNKVADYLLDNPQTTIDIKGYTDSVGEASTNLSVSRKRARAVKNYLIARGVDASRIFAEGYGGTNFIESNKTEKLRALNRRIELHIN